MRWWALLYLPIYFLNARGLVCYVFFNIVREQLGGGFLYLAVLLDGLGMLSQKIPKGEVAAKLFGVLGTHI